MADGSGLPAEARLAQSTKRPAADGTVEIGSENRRKTASGTEETGGTDHRKTAGVVDQGRTRPGRPLTTQQKRIFVLGLGADEKN
jgi:hypothetical protein